MLTVSKNPGAREGKGDRTMASQDRRTVGGGQEGQRLPARLRPAGGVSPGESVRGWAERALRGIVGAAAALLIAAPGIGSGAQADSQNVSLLGQFHAYGYYSDIWGYAAGGVELAIIGTFDGTSFVDVSDPTQPQEAAFIPGPGSGWRDIKTYAGHAYIVNETGGGLQIVSLSDPLNPALVAEYDGAFQECHNIFVDEATGVLYAVGTEDGTQILSLADPLNPTIITGYDVFPIHDIYIRGGLAYAANAHDGELVILDVSGLPVIEILDSVVTPGAVSHNTWLNGSGSLCLNSDETTGGHLTVYDVADPGDIVYKSEWMNPEEPSSTIHNVTAIGDVAYCSWYTAGLQIIDLSDPTVPVRLGYYDTHPGDSGFDGAWGVYPFSPSGVVYVSDIQTGLYVLSNPAAAGAPGARAAARGVRLLAARPNPAPGRPVLRFRLPRAQPARLQVFDARGRLVDTVLEGELGPGLHEVDWNARRLPSGVYFQRITSGGESQARKLMLAH
ncbi:MAG: choice-of-anchor B family protein [Candidatus Eisenbacteria bacterium]|nr:choice-of-anchor B family protein [Candidatus Eisenbacteria bacterium]